MSKPSPTAFNHSSPSINSPLLSTSVPVSSTYGTNPTTQRRSSLVEPVIDDAEVLSSTSSSSLLSVNNLRRKEAPALNQTNGEEEEWCHVVRPEDANKRKDHQTTELQTLIHLVKGNVGTGLLALPLALSNAGLAVGGVSLILLGIIATHCMLMLVAVAHKLCERHHTFKTLNYAQAAEVAISEYTHKEWIVKVTGTIVNIFLIITQFGFCCVYFVFIGRHLNQVFCSAFGISIGVKELDGVQTWIAVIIIPIVVFCWIRNLESLSSFSLLANVCIAFSLSVLLYEGIYSFTSTDPNYQAAAIRPENVDDNKGHGGGIIYAPTTFTGMALFFGNAVYAFEGIGMVLPLENKMKRPQNFKRVTILGMFIVIFLYVFVGVLGYIVFGQSAEGSVTLNLEESYDRIGASIAFLVAKLYFAYAIFASFMLQFYVPMDFLEPPLNRIINRLKERHYLVYRFPAHHNWLNTVLLLVFRTLVILVIASFAMALPDLDDLIALIGAVASSALALIYPPLLHMLVFLKHDHSRPLTCVGDRDSNTMINYYAPSSKLKQVTKVAWVVKDVLIMVLGLAGLVFGTYAAINGLVEFFKNNDNGNSSCVKFLYY